MKQIRFGSLNLQNLQLPNEALYAHTKKYTREEYEQKTSWLGQLVRRLEPDIIGFQELWSARCLQDVVSREYQLVTAPQKRDVGGEINVALAARTGFEIVETEWIRNLPEELVLLKREPGSPGMPDFEMKVDIPRFSRAVLRCKIKGPYGSPIQFFVAHFKSMIPMDLDAEELKQERVKAHAADLGKALSAVRRSAEATGLRILLNKIMRKTDEPVAVVGDLNDCPDSVTLSIVSSEPAYRLHTKERVGMRSDLGLYSAGLLQDQRAFRDVYYTYVHNGRYNALDHILVSEQFYDYSSKREWCFRDVRVLNDHLDERDTNELCRIYSDHAGVAATFDWDPAKPKG